MAVPDPESSFDDFFNGEWIRRATLWEENFEVCNRYKNFLIWYQLDLKSKSALKEADVRKALHYLYKKCPNLSVCMGIHNCDKWVRRATNPNLDFKVLKGETLGGVRKFLHRYVYDLQTGPLFCARLVFDPPDAFNNMDEDDHDLHHRSHLLFGFAHMFVDSTSIMHILGFFIVLLSDVIAKRKIDDRITFGTFIDDEYTRIAIHAKSILLRDGPALQQKLLKERQRYETCTPYIIKAFPAPNEKKGTDTLVKIFDYTTTMKFMEVCNRKDASLRSGFTGVVNVALVDLLVESGIIQTSYEIQSFLLVNLRQYWELKISKALGLHIGYPLTLYKETPRRAQRYFWEYVQTLRKDIREGIDTGKVLLQEAYQYHSGQGLYSNESVLKVKHYAGDYVLSNLGDVTAKITEGGEHVRISHVFGSTSLHLSEFPIGIECFIFRSRLTITFSYNTAAVSRDTLEKFADKIINRIVSTAE